MESKTEVKQHHQGERRLGARGSEGGEVGYQSLLEYKQGRKYTFIVLWLLVNDVGIITFPMDEGVFA